MPEINLQLNLAMFIPPLKSKGKTSQSLRVTVVPGLVITIFNYDNGKERLTKRGLRVSALPRRFNLQTPLAVGLTAEGIFLKERIHKGSPERMHRMAQWLICLSNLQI